MPAVPHQPSEQLQNDDALLSLLSLRVPLTVARDFRMEAARRGIRQNALFEDLWRLYQEQSHGAL